MGQAIGRLNTYYGMRPWEAEEAADFLKQLPFSGTHPMWQSMARRYFISLIKFDDLTKVSSLD